MKVKLKVVHGRLKGKGGDAALEVAIKSRRFKIGAAEDCQMRCPSGSISNHHCEIEIVDCEVRLRDLGSESGTFLNDQPVEDERLLESGDRLRVGRLEFELLIDRPAPGSRLAERDPVDDFVSDLLVEADEEERATRLADPRLREFQLDENKPEEPAAEELEEEEDKEAALRRKLPPKGKPGKLPKPPAITADSTVAAAEESLKKFFEKQKPKSPDN
jgi:pSer/pThr/pTyr-binding forkhead associated (FHA) protein